MLLYNTSFSVPREKRDLAQKLSEQVQQPLIAAIKTKMGSNNIVSRVGRFDACLLLLRVDAKG
jgi:hypothetical protein